MPAMAARAGRGPVDDEGDDDQAGRDHHADDNAAEPELVGVATLGHGLDGQFDVRLPEEVSSMATRAAVAATPPSSTQRMAVTSGTSMKTSRMA